MPSCDIATPAAPPCVEGGAGAVPLHNERPRRLEHLHADYGPLLHDIGKLAVSDAILHKPAPLTADEQIEMRQHVEIGVRILQPIPGFEPVCEFANATPTFAEPA